MVKVRFLGGTCLEIIGVNDHLIIDTVYDVEPKAGINTILISQDNIRHFSEDTLKKIIQEFSIKEEKLKVYGPKEIKKFFNDDELEDFNFTEVKDNKEFSTKDFKIRVFRMKCMHPGDSYGYIISKGQTSILHTSDAIEFSKRFRKLENKVDYCFISSYEKYFDKYVEFITDISPKVVFPYNFHGKEDEHAMKLTSMINQQGFEAKYIEVGTEFEF